MTDIFQFVQSASSQLGVSEDAAKQATGGILEALQADSDESDVQQLLSAVPGASQLLSQAQSGGGGGLLGAASSLLGGSGGMGSTLSALASIQQSGLSMDKVSSLVPLLLNFLQSQAGKDLVGKLLETSPELKKLMG